jgi:methylated-DNA-protein-cysteine methyltransferase-like protein
MSKIKVFEEIYKVVKKIPKGKVMTYGQVAEQVNSISLSSRKRVGARTVGWALHANPDPKNIPCHRVVKKDGRLSEGYAYGGMNQQKKRLLEEGVKFQSTRMVDRRAII